MPRICIFHTSDMHNKLRPEWAERLRELKAQHRASLVLDSGDAIWSGNIYWRPGGEPVLDLMNSVPYDALCMGNREFHFLAAGLNAKTSRARFPVLSANLRRARAASGSAGNPNEAQVARSDEPNSLPARSCVLFELDGARVGVFGLSVPCVTEKMLVKKVSDFYFEQPLAAAREVVPELRRQCDLVIALTHIGLQQDRQLAASVEGIDVILGGHTHALLDRPERAASTWIVHSGCYGHYVNAVSIDLAPCTVDVTSELIPLAKA